MKYIQILLAGNVLIMHLLMIINLLFKPNFLNKKIFQVPSSKIMISFYYLNTIFLMVLYIMGKMGIEVFKL